MNVSMMPGETFAGYVDRMASVCIVATRRQVGKSACGCPNRSDGSPAERHVCLSCGHIDTYGDVHEQCAGCGRSGLIVP